MKSRILTVFIVMLALVGSSLADGGRKTIKQRKPAYPALARQMNLRGAVTIELTISPSGRVTETHVVGGSPVLIPAALDAVKDWSYEPASATTTEIVKINFGGSD